MTPLMRDSISPVEIEISSEIAHQSAPLMDISTTAQLPRSDPATPYSNSTPKPNPHPHSNPNPNPNPNQVRSRPGR